MSPCAISLERPREEIRPVMVEDLFTNHCGQATKVGLCFRSTSPFHRGYADIRRLLCQSIAEEVLTRQDFLPIDVDKVWWLKAFEDENMQDRKLWAVFSDLDLARNPVGDLIVVVGNSQEDVKLKLASLNRATDVVQA